MASCLPILGTSNYASLAALLFMEQLLVFPVPWLRVHVPEAQSLFLPPRVPSRFPLHSQSRQWSEPSSGRFGERRCQFPACSISGDRICSRSGAERQCRRRLPQPGPPKQQTSAATTLRIITAPWGGIGIGSPSRIGKDAGCAGSTRANAAQQRKDPQLGPEAPVPEQE